MQYCRQLYYIWYDHSRQYSLLPLVDRRICAARVPSSSSERFFSAPKLLVDNKWSRLNRNVIDELIFIALSSWAVVITRSYWSFLSHSMNHFRKVNFSSFVHNLDSLVKKGLFLWRPLSCMSNDKIWRNSKPTKFIIRANQRSKFSSRSGLNGGKVNALLDDCQQQKGSR